MNIFNRYLLWPLILTSHLLATSLLAWHVLAQFDFGYPLAYKLLAIDEHIQEYGPQNRHKVDFAQTTSAEHKQLFSEITHAVQNSGQGLAQIRYRLPNGELTPLMREPEVIHLQDVANLINIFYSAGLISAGLWLLLFVYAYGTRQAFPNAKKILLGFILALAALTTTTLLLGAERVFYWLHEQIFPDDHEWFFFYQDSLMTTLMHAPQLFGLISALLVALLLLLWGLSVWAMVSALNSSQSAFGMNNGKTTTKRQIKVKNKK